MKLYTFWRSQTAFRVRIALNLKGRTREDIVINLNRGDQFKPEYKAQNPQAVVPTLYDGNAKLFQSVAILEHLEEKHPNPPILPKDLLARGWVRGFALINAADSHPLIIPRIRNYLANVLKVDEAGRTAWIQHWLGSVAGDGGVASGEESDRQVLRRRQPDHCRYLPGDASDAGAAIQHRRRALQASDAHLRRLHGDPRFRRRTSVQASRFRGALIPAGEPVCQRERLRFQNHPRRKRCCWIS